MYCLGVERNVGSKDSGFLNQNTSVCVSVMFVCVCAMCGPAARVCGCAACVLCACCSCMCRVR